MFKDENFKHIHEQNEFLATPMGKGLLLLSLSLIKYRYIETDESICTECPHFSWYSVMKTNYIKLVTEAALERRRQNMQEEIEMMEKIKEADAKKLSEAATNLKKKV